jgi:hypothetical protein
MEGRFSRAEERLPGKHARGIGMVLQRQMETLPPAQGNTKQYRATRYRARACWVGAGWGNLAALLLHRAGLTDVPDSGGIGRSWQTDRSSSTISDPPLQLHNIPTVGAKPLCESWRQTIAGSEQVVGPSRRPVPRLAVQGNAMPGEIGRDEMRLDGIGRAYRLDHRPAPIPGRASCQDVVDTAGSPLVYNIYNCNVNNAW